MTEAYRGTWNLDKCGTLTVTVGGKSVMLDPKDDWPKFNNNKAKIEMMLAAVERDVPRGADALDNSGIVSGASFCSLETDKGEA